jgi:hypothetical protein
VDESRIFLRTVRPPSDASGVQRTDAGNGVPGHLFEPAVCNGRYVSQVLADGFVRVLAHILTQETGYSQEMGFLCVNATRLARHTTDHETRRSVLMVMLNADDDRYRCVPASTVAAMMETGPTKTKKSNQKGLIVDVPRLPSIPQSIPSVHLSPTPPNRLSTMFLWAEWNDEFRALCCFDQGWENL